MIQPAPQPDHPEGDHGISDRASAMRVLRQARGALAAIPKTLESLVESISNDSEDEFGALLFQAMKTLLEAAAAVVDATTSLSALLNEDFREGVGTAQREFSRTLLRFRRAMGTGSTDTIRQSVRGDLMDAAKRWNRLLDDVLVHLESIREDT